MTKRQAIARDVAMREIDVLVAENYTLDVLKEKVTALAKEFYPKADELLINSFYNYAYHAQHYTFSQKMLRTVINRFVREVKASFLDCRGKRP